MMQLFQSIPLLLAFLLGSCAKRYEPNWNSLDTRPLPPWYDEAKVGIFIHWGIFSVPSYVDEWFWNWWRDGLNFNIEEYMAHNYRHDFTYPQFAPHFTAELFNATQWAALFKKSGARYAVLTTKHHEGFTLWPSKYSFNWNAKDVGPRRDLVGEFSNAIRDAGLHLGLYHSLFEWYHPLYLKDHDNGFQTHDFVKLKCRPELEELINTYKPDLLWSDGDGTANDAYWNSTHFLAWLYNDSPVREVVVTNDRWGRGNECKHGDFISCADRYNPGTLQRRKWENAMTIDKRSWGYRREASIHDYMSITALLNTLIEAVAYGGNILINIGPTKDGRIMPIFEERLTQLGKWLDVNGEAIYASQVFELCQKDNQTANVFYTRKGRVVYGMSTFWPKNGQIEFGCINARQLRAVSMLGSADKIRFKSSSNGTVVYFPRWTPNSKLHYAYTVKFNM